MDEENEVKKTNLVSKIFSMKLKRVKKELKYL